MQFEVMYVLMNPCSLKHTELELQSYSKKPEWKFNTMSG